MLRAAFCTGAVQSQRLYENAKPQALRSYRLPCVLRAHRRRRTLFLGRPGSAIPAQSILAARGKATFDLTRGLWMTPGGHQKASSSLRVYIPPTS